MRKFLSGVPIPMAGVALGFTVLGNLLNDYSTYLRTACGCIAGAIIILVLMKFIFCFKQVREDFKNPIIVSVSATIYMAFMQLAVYLNGLTFIPNIYMISKTLWFIGVIMHCIVIVYFTYKLIAELKLHHVYPTYFVTYVGIVVASVTAPTFGEQQLGNYIFWFGLCAYIAVFLLVSYRYLRHEVEEASKPLFAIYTAPMSLSIVGYLTISSNPDPMFMLTMEVLAQILYIVVLFQIPKIIKLPFYPSYAALTFPMCITPFALLKTISFFEQNFSANISGIVALIYVMELTIAILIVGYVFNHYLKFLFNNLKKSMKK